LYYIQHTMSPKGRVVTFRPDDEDLAAMEALRQRDGVPYSEQIRRALKAWLQSKDIAERKRAGTRKRP
jgi:hypothetical protein